MYNKSAIDKMGSIPYRVEELPIGRL